MLVHHSLMASNPWPSLENPPLILSSLAVILWALMMLVNMSLQSLHTLCWMPPVLLDPSLMDWRLATIVLSMLRALCSLGLLSELSDVTDDLDDDLNECLSWLLVKLVVKLLDDLSGLSRLLFCSWLSWVVREQTRISWSLSDGRLILPTQLLHTFLRHN